MSAPSSGNWRSHQRGRGERRCQNQPQLQASQQLPSEAQAQAQSQPDGPSQVGCNCGLETVSQSRRNCINHAKCPLALECDVCDSEFSPNFFLPHVRADRHKKRLKCFEDCLYRIQLPPPTAAQLDYYSKWLPQQGQRLRLEESEVRRREDAVRRVEKQLQENISEKLSVRLFGSTITGFATKSSDINMELLIEGRPAMGIDRDEDPNQTESSAELLARISTLLSTYSCYRNVWNEFNVNVPKVHFSEGSSKYCFELVLTADKSYLTSMLLKKYCLLDPRLSILGHCFRKWAECCLFDIQENGTWPPHAFPILVIYFLQRCSPPVLPCLHDYLEPEGENIESFDVSQINWKVSNDDSIGKLWLDLLRFYAVVFKSGRDVVSIRKLGKPDKHADKGWGSRVLAIEDPLRPHLNLSRCVGNMQIYNFVMYMLRNTFEYFSIPMKREQAFYNRDDFEMIITSHNMTPKSNKEVDSEGESGDDSEANSDETNETRSESREKRKMMIDNPDNFMRRTQTVMKKHAIKFQLRPAIQALVHALDVTYFEYNLDMKQRPFFQHPPKYCRLCHRTNHYQGKCPTERLPTLVELPDKMRDLHKQVLDDLCLEIYNEQKLDEEGERYHAVIVEDLESFIRKQFKEAKLELFGSSKNGFGARKCDLDICLTFSSDPTGENLNQPKIIEDLAFLLQNHPFASRIEPITSAKVPILKFIYNDKKMGQEFECDISLYNILAKYNTQLLRTFCDIDQRVQILGFIVKYFAKTCDIGDASRGSLSSYAYTLMTIHFLQQRVPPVIPVLQELYQQEKPERIIDNWNTWFYADIQNLASVWPEYGKNKESMAELFLGFLRYFSEGLKFDENVVCCRQKKPLTRLEKMWTGKRVTIEDPFLLAHNLGQGVDDQMASFIKTALCKGRNHFGNPPDVLPNNRETWRQYFFDRSKLIEGNLPTGRGCRLCGKIGHKIKDCDRKRQNRRPNNAGGARQGPATEVQGYKIHPNAHQNLYQHHQFHQQIRGRIPSKGFSRLMRAEFQGSQTDHSHRPFTARGAGQQVQRPELRFGGHPVQTSFALPIRGPPPISIPFNPQNINMNTGSAYRPPPFGPNAGRPQFVEPPSSGPEKEHLLGSPPSKGSRPGEYWSPGKRNSPGKRGSAKGSPPHKGFNNNTDFSDDFRR